MQLRIEFQESRVADPVSAVTAVVRPILEGLLYRLRRDRADRFGGYEHVTLTDLVEEYHAGDGDCGICFEYAIHDAVRRGESLVIERIDDVLVNFCDITGGLINSILFGAEKNGSRRLIETANELLTPDSRIMVGGRGQPPFLKRHLENAVRDFRNRAAEPSLPSSIRGIWKADLFLGKPNVDRWVATTVKINPTQLEGAPGLRVGIVAANGRRDTPYRDEEKNLIVCPLPLDGEFMEVFYTAWNTVRQFIDKRGRMPDPAFLPNAVARRVCGELVDRMRYPVLTVIEALQPQSQPALLRSHNHSVSLSDPHLEGGEMHEVDTDLVVAPVSGAT